MNDKLVQVNRHTFPYKDLGEISPEETEALGKIIGSKDPAEICAFALRLLKDLTENEGCTIVRIGDRWELLI